MRAGALSLLLSPLILLGAERPASAAEPPACADIAGEVISAEGAVSFRGGGDWRSAESGQGLCERDSVRTGPNSRAAIRLMDDAVLRLDESTTLVLADVAPAPAEPSYLELIAGAIQSFSRRPQTLEIDTPYVNATIEGTEFVMRVEEGRTTLAVLEGTVTASNEAGSLRVESGSAILAAAGAAPRAILIADPVDAVEWGLYYPPVLALSGVDESGPELDRAQALIAQDRTSEALGSLLAGSPPGDRARVYAAALLLSVGQVEEARRILDDVLRVVPDSGPALAQLAVIDIVQNRTGAALATAERAVAAAPDEPAPYVALSLAQQNAFRLQDARDTLLEGVKRVPNSALLWARLSEIWLSLGYRDRSADAADRALELDPQVARAHVMRGFAALTSFDTQAATRAFDQAVLLEPADPLPHLGLGLALIREGDLEAGRRQIDAAVALDATRSLLRSYLGKAYFEEDRNELALQQFEIAKELDPDDPTPHFYESILLQTENRPGEALQSMQQAIDLNENRAPFRSRLALDQDLAARGASLGRIYEDLGFIQLGMLEATAAQSLDPANAAAHRFLADIYRNERRRELARVSELLRAQLLQDVNLYPVQPSMTETNLSLVNLGGPANAGFNEFTALFASDGARFTGSGVIGNHDTFGGEAAAAFQDDGVSVSFGGFEFTTDGFRDNFEARHSIYDLFAQWAVTPEFNVQAELRHRESSLGDLDLHFNPDVLRPALDVGFEEMSARFGARYSPDPHNDTLLSLIYGERKISEFNEFGPVVSAVQLQDGDGWQAELQHIYQQDWFSITVGGLFSKFNEDLRVDVFFDDVFAFDIPGGTTPQKNTRLYAYGTVELPIPEMLGDLMLTLGASYEGYHEEVPGFDAELDLDEINPKAGLLWNVTDDLSFRAAYFETVKPSFVTNRTIEPTQIAGFNQFFDDVVGASTKRWGVGVDYRVTNKAFVGAEATWREVDVPLFTVDQFGVGSFPETDWEEATHRAYVNLLPHPRVPVSLEFIYDRFEADSSGFTSGGFIPTKVETFSVPVTVRYFDPSGFFAGVRGSYVHQEVDRENPALIGLADGKSDFFNVDLVGGYRFPNDRGSVTLEVHNLTDNDFKFQDDGFREFTNFGATGPYFPDLSVLGRLTVNF